MNNNISFFILTLLLLSFSYGCEKKQIIEVSDKGEVYLFSKNGKEKLKVSFKENGNGFSIVTYQENSEQVLHFFQETGMLKSKTMLNSEKQIFGKDYFFYNKTGVLKSHFDFDGDRMPSSGTIYYDTTGRIKTLLFYNENGVITEKTEISRDGESMVSFGRDSITHSIFRSSF